MRVTPVGLVVNPRSGKDVRRAFGRAASDTNESKRNQLQRAVVGAAASGAERFVWVDDLFSVSRGALETIGIDVAIERLDIGPIRTAPDDTLRAVRVMHAAGCGALVVLGGDGTNRLVVQAWPDAPLVALSTGTNNVFPERVEATLAGAAAGLVAAGRLPLGEVARRAKVVRVRWPDGAESVAVVDVVLVVDDHVGSLLPFEPEKIRRVVLARAEPDAVGMSPIGGLLVPARRDDDFGVEVRCVAPGGGTPLRVPISPGLYRTAHVEGARRVGLGEAVVLEGPGVVELDGDRERVLASGERAVARVERDGPWVIDVGRALALAAERRLYLDLPAWHDEGDPGGSGPGCC
jgi:hypothetical protein